MNIKYTLISICQSMAYISALYTLYVVMANKPVDEHSTHLTIVNVGVLRNFSAMLAPFIAEMKHQKHVYSLYLHLSFNNFINYCKRGNKLRKLLLLSIKMLHIRNSQFSIYGKVTIMVTKALLRAWVSTCKPVRSVLSM